jgi:DNA-binding NtrC family response regulator
MKVQDLDLRELLDSPPVGGTLHFGGKRTLLLDADALGLLRKQLVDALGLSNARGLLHQFGFAHGWAVAESMRHAYPWDDESQWRRAGGRLHTLQGFVTVEIPVRDPKDGPAPFAESIWRDSFEAEQHLKLFGRSEESVCWMLTGYASGYMSCCNGADIFCVEDRCVAKGDATCHVVGKSKEEWGEQFDSIFTRCREFCLDANLQKLVTEMKETETSLRRRRRALGKASAALDEPSGIVSRSEGMLKVLALARRVAKVDSTVLITGESGVGKERISRLVHDESTRAAAPFVAVNCAAMTETLLESELFGHSKGSFTGATADHAGLFEAAHGGTLFLDEVGEITPGMQAKLLRVLQEREVRRVGETKSRAIDVRIIAATNRDLNADVGSGQFRKDLYYRLKVVELKIPPLRERREDILPLARVLLQTVAERMHRTISGLTAEAADQLLRYSWPGNVRELENTMERAAALAESDRVSVEDLPEEIRAALPGAFDTGEVRPLEAVERDYILAALHANNGHQGKTAAQLGIGTATLYRRLKQYNVGAMN